MDPKKGWAALLAVVIALSGVLLELRWLTVAALVLWVAAMITFGFGERRASSRLSDDDE